MDINNKKGFKVNDLKVATKTTVTAMIQKCKSLVSELMLYPKCLYKMTEIQLGRYCGVLRGIKIQIVFLHAV